ncbi:MAG: TIGR02996 domain-containing protein [Myxococcaceae bacterium]
MLPKGLSCPGEWLDWADSRALGWLVRHQEGTAHGKRTWHLPPDERDEGLAACADALRAMDVLAQMVPPGGDGVPLERITSAVGRKIAETEPTRFSALRIQTRRKVFEQIRDALLASQPVTTRDPNLDQLFSAVLARPTDDDPRLVFADAIGATDPECAEFILAQIEQRRLERLGQKPSPERADLIRAHLLRFADVWSNGLSSEVDAFHFSGGFVERIELSAAQLAARAEIVFARAPIRHVVLTQVESSLPEALARPELQRIEVLELRGKGGTMALALAAPLANLRVLDLRGVKSGIAPKLAWPRLEQLLLPLPA